MSITYRTFLLFNALIAICFVRSAVHLPDAMRSNASKNVA
jgi:hypothetical protein